MSGKKTNIYFLIIFIFYAALRIALNLPALENPRELADTVSYLRVSQIPVTSPAFYTDARAFVFPLLLKISQQDVSTAAWIQLTISILVWGLLALSISASLRGFWLRLASFGMILALSLTRHLASWDYVMMTESLSISWLVLFTALGVWLVQDWRIYKLIPLSIAAFLLAFTRDTNAYLLLMFAGLILPAVLFKWMKPRALLVGMVFLVIFLFNTYASEAGSRWEFPLNNIIGRRILPISQNVNDFEACGMPVSNELLALANTFANGADRAFYEDPALAAYREWLHANGKTCYMKWLISHPIRHSAEALTEFQTLIAFDKLDKFYARSYDPVIPHFVEPFIYPVNFIIPLWLLMTALAVYAIWNKLWQSQSLWVVYLLLVLPIFPHLFITWHGDAMAPERHALSVGLQLALSFWLALFLAVDGNMKNETHDVRS